MATVRVHTVHCASQLMDCQASEGITRHYRLQNFSKKRKKNNHWSTEKSKNRQIEICRKMRQENCRGWQKTSELHCFSIAKWMIKVAARSGCPVSNPDPNNTIGLCFYLSYCRAFIIHVACVINYYKRDRSNTYSKTWILSLILRKRILYSRKFSSAKNFVKSDHRVWQFVRNLFSPNVGRRLFAPWSFGLVKKKLVRILV